MRKVKISLILYIVAIVNLNAGGSCVEKLDMPLVTTSLPYSVGFKAGTLGAGIDISTALYDDLYARLNINGAKLDIDGSKEEIKYNSKVDLFTAGVLLDYYPFVDKTLHFSAGAYYYANKAMADGTPKANSYIVGKHTYTKEQMGKLYGSVEFSKFAPYIGFGYGGRSSVSGWSLSIDVGLMYHGDGDLALNVNRGNISNTKFIQLKDDLELERIDMQNDLRDMPFYPVVMIGAVYTF